MKPISTSRKLSYQLLRTSSVVLLALTGIACDGGSIIMPGTAVTAPVTQNDDTAIPPIASVTGDDEQEPSVTVQAPVPAVTPPQPSALALQALSQEAKDLMAAAHARGSIRFMPVGDSITHGTRDSDSYRREFLSLMGEGGCSARTVGSQSSTFHQTGYYAAHEGYSGHTADYFINGKTTSSGENLGISHSVSYQKPDVVLLHLGSVDIFKGETVASTVAEVDQVIASIYDSKPDTVVFVANIIPWYDTSAGMEIPLSIEQLGDGIEQIVQESNNPLLALVDVRSGFNTGLMQNDMIHPNDEGDKHIADAFYDRVASAGACQ